MAKQNHLRNIVFVTLIGTAIVTAAACLLFAVTTSASAGGFRPPFDGTKRLTVFFDHQTPRCYWAGQPACDGYVWIYTGDRRPDYSPYPYDGHEGVDWSMPDGTPVYAAASGVVVAFGSVSGYGNRVVIDHQNGYFTLYAHLQGFNNLWLGKPVAAGDLIAQSGHTGCGTCGAHLHFGAYHNNWTAGHETDPFGWRGSVADPLIAYNGETASCLWRSSDEDSVSCADTIVEDGGRGFNKAGTWYTSTLGNGYHMYYAPTTNVWNWSIYSEWAITPTVSGPYKLFAYVPSEFATTRGARYWIYSVDCPSYCEKLLDQSAYTDTWAFLGTYTLPVGAQGGHVFLYINTGESPAKNAAADAIKFRSYTVFLPAILKDYP
jgi:murein DD-endopeptidase MepM/ murein hydrolase activator NlpD